MHTWKADLKVKCTQYKRIFNDSASICIEKGVFSSAFTKNLVEIFFIRGRTGEDFTMILQMMKFCVNVIVSHFCQTLHVLINKRKESIHQRIAWETWSCCKNTSAFKKRNPSMMRCRNFSACSFACSLLCVLQNLNHYFYAIVEKNIRLVL